MSSPFNAPHHPTCSCRLCRPDPTQPTTHWPDPAQGETCSVSWRERHLTYETATHYCINPPECGGNHLCTCGCTMNSIPISERLA